MADAKYTIHVPAIDELGRPLRLHEAVHTHLNDLGVKAAQIHTGTPSHVVSGWAEDTPEWDSTAKQLGTHTGELANVPMVHVTKEGDKSAAWEMSNPNYRPQEGADPAALYPSIHEELTLAKALDETP